MTDVHIIGLHEVADSIEMLARLLAAEEHDVRLSVGRQALVDLESPRRPQDIVLVAWSPDVAHQLFIAEWAARTGPDRLVEISFHLAHPPQVARNAPVIDFTHWRGERGGRAWNALAERLRAAARTMEPAKAPPKQAALALAAGGAMAIGAALALRLHAPDPMLVASFEPEAPIEAQTGVGGALDQSDIIEPPSVDDVFGARRLPARMATMPRNAYEPLMALTEYSEAELRDPTWRERLRDLNPLRSNRQDGG